MTAGHTALWGSRTAGARAGGRRKGRHGLDRDGERVLELQHQAGNRAVGQLLSGNAPPSVQRALSIGPADLRTGRSLKERARSVFGSDTYSKIIAAVRDFQRKPDLPTGKLAVRLIDYWLGKYGKESKPMLVFRRQMLEQLRAEVWRDVGKLAAEAVYTQDFAGGEGRHFPLQGVNAVTKQYALGTAKTLASGKTGPGAGADQAALDLIAKYKLSEAEIAAVRTYTLGDYKYINPSTASNQVWLDSQIAGGAAQFNVGAGKKALLEEGRLHAGVMMEAMAKLPRYEGPLYRGERVSPKELSDRYLGKSVYEYLNFGSASKSFSAAQKFANGQGDSAPRADQSISVFIYLTVTNGRDISKLSAIAKEGEVSILPGAKFTIERLETLPSGPEGTPKVPAKRWVVIKLSQTQ